MKIFSHHVSTHAVTLFVADIGCTLVALSSCHFLVSLGSGRIDFWGSSFNSLGYLVLVLIGMGAMGAYSSKQRYKIEGAVARTFIAVCIAATGSVILQFLGGGGESRIAWILTFVTTFVLLSLVRVLTYHTLDEDVFRRRVLVYGAGQRASSILQLRRQSDQRGFRVVGFVPAPGDTRRIDDERVLTGVADQSLMSLVAQHNVDEIVVAVDDRRRGFPIAELLECKLSGVPVLDLLEFLERETGRVKVDIMDPSWLIFSNTLQRRNRDRWTFRALDLFIAITVLIFVWPIMIIVALLVTLDDGLPVIYSQWRVGLNRRHFKIYKFRSMRKDAEAAGAPVWATERDPRITRVGHWLRKFRLDELPQLFNVLRGDMSIVGPRPERPEFVEDLANKIPYYHERHYVKPGITGWAQLCYPYGASERDALGKLEYDLYYVKNRSIVFYLIILLQTAEVILWQKGSR